MTDAPDPLATFTVDTFSPRVGEEFRLSDDNGATIPTRLLQATTGARGVHREQFSLVFRAPNGTTLPQGIYRVEHDEMGSFGLFLVPLGPDGEGMRYEAVFT